MLPRAFEKGKDLLTDTLVYAAVVLIAFGVANRWQDGRTSSVILYGAILFLIYAVWIAKPYKDDPA